MTEIDVFSVVIPDIPLMDVVFLHGLDGDARKTWAAGEAFWPDWLGQDVAGVAVWSVDYAASPSGWLGRAMPIQGRAVNVLAALQNAGVGQRPLVFVTHSMGGLLAKQMLRHADSSPTYASFAAAARGVVFLATPHIGAGMAKVLTSLKIVLRTTAAGKDLERNAAHLQDLNLWYRNWAFKTGIRNLVFYEAYPIFGVCVVDAGSADPGLAGVDPIPIDADHFDICKPASRSTLVYGQVKRFITIIHDVIPACDPSTTLLSTTTPLASTAQPPRAPVAIAEHPDGSHGRSTHNVNATDAAGDDGWPYVRDIDPLDVGVKPSVPVVDSDSPIALWLEHKTPRRRMSSYTVRDHDADLRARLGRALQRQSDAVILTGRSCTGKSRSAWEAIREILPDWHFVIATNPAEVERLSRAKPPAGGVVLWLDNLRAGTGVAEAVKAAVAVLRDRGRSYQVVAVATMWHAPAVDSANQPTASADSSAMKELDIYAGSHVLVEEPWSEAEFQRGWARSVEAEDELLAAALRQQDVSPPQVLAGAHWAINLWQSPVRRETRSLLTAAIDLASFGFGVDPRMPLTLRLLREATSVYLLRPPVSQSWFDDALAEATHPLEEAVWALRPPFPDPSGSYTLLDPLLELGRLMRFHEPLPEAVWHLFTRAGLTQYPLQVLTRSAEHRLLHPIAAALGRAAAAAAPTPGPPPTTKPARPIPPAPRPVATPDTPTRPVPLDLAAPDRDRADQLLADDNYDELVALAIASNDTYVRRRLAMLYERHGETDKLRQLASFSNRGGRHFVEHLCKAGNITELLRMVAAGDGHARRAIDVWTITGLSEATRQAILERGLQPDGKPHVGEPATDPG